MAIVLIIAPAATCVAAFDDDSHRHPHIAALNRHASVLGILAALAACVGLFAWRLWDVREGPGTIIVRRRRFDVRAGGREWRVPFDLIATGTTVPRGPSHEAWLLLRRGDEIHVALEAQECEALLSAAKVDARRRVFEVSLGRFRSPRVRAYLTYLLGFASAGVASRLAVAIAVAVPAAAIHRWAIGEALALATFFGVLRVTRPTRLRIGADGVEIRSVWRSRFLPYSTLRYASFDLRSSIIELGLRDRVTALRWSALAIDPAVARAAVSRIDLAGRAAHEAASGRDARGADEFFGRHGATVAKWRERLHRAFEMGAAYRAQAVDAGVIQRVLADPTANFDDRVGAALLQVALDPKAGAAAVRDAADGCADGRLRRALLRAADGTLDDSDLEG